MKRHFILLLILSATLNSLFANPIILPPLLQISEFYTADSTWVLEVKVLYAEGAHRNLDSVKFISLSDSSYFKTGIEVATRRYTAVDNG